MQKVGLKMSENDGQNRKAEPTVNRGVRKATMALGIVVLSLVLLTGLLGGRGPVRAEGATISLSPTPLVLELEGAGFVDQQALCTQQIAALDEGLNELFLRCRERHAGLRQAPEPGQRIVDREAQRTRGLDRRTPSG